MGTTAQKLNRVLETKSDLKTVINYSGANITNETTFKDYPKLLNKAYIDILNDEGESLYNALPKTIVTGTSINLDVEKGKMKIELNSSDSTQSGTPTQDTPQDIHVITGGNNIKIQNKNLFDKNNMTVLNGYLWQNQMVLRDTYNDRICCIPCKKNTTYTISRSVLTNNFRAATYNEDNIPVVTTERVYYSCYNEINNDTGEYITITTDNNSKYLLLMYCNIVRDVDIDESVATIQIEESATPRNYIEHQEQNYPINLGKNLFDKDNTNYFNAYISVGSRKIVAGNDDRTIYIKCKPNTTYTIQKMVQETTSRNRFVVGTTSSIPTIEDVMNDFHYYDGGTTNTTLTLTTGPTANYLCVFCWSIDSVTTFEDMLNSIQIEVGPATSYTPYFEPIELCKIGDYQDYIYNQNGDWYLHKEIGKIILNGGSNESYAYQNNHRFWLRRSYWTDETVPKNTTPTSQTFGIYCNRFKEQSANGTWNGIEGISYDGNNIVDLPIGGTLNIACNSVATNETNFKTWLSSNNLIVYYILQNQQDIQITDTTLIQQLDNLKNAKSYDDVTHIMQTNADLPFNLEVSALAKIE